MSLSPMDDLSELAAAARHQSTPASPPRDDANRRSACDRCRRQKLRCERKPSATTLDPCKRCIKSRSKCVTGPSLPMGRPRIRTRSASPFDYRSMKRDCHPLVSEFTPPMGVVRRNKTTPPASSGGATPLPEIACTDMSAINGLAHNHMPMMPTMPEPKLASESGYSDYQTTCSSASQTIVPPGPCSWDDMLHRLQDLNSRLLGLCHSFNNTSSSHNWPYGDQNSLNIYAPYIASSVESQVAPVVSVGTVLDSSNEFLKIAQNLLFPHPGMTPMSSRHSSIDCGGLGYAHTGYQRMSDGSISYGQNPSAIYDEHESEFSPSSIPSLTSSISTAASAGAPRSLDFPTLLTLVSSYTALLRIYRTVLTRVQLVMLSQPMTWGFLESVLPGLYPDGLATEQRPGGQVRLFAQVAQRSLEQMERSVSFATKLFSCSADADVATGLLEAMVRAEAAEGASRIVSPKTMVEDILRTIDGGMGM